MPSFSNIIVRVGYDRQRLTLLGGPLLHLDIWWQEPSRPASHKHPPPYRLPIRLDDKVASLARVDHDTISLVWLDGNKVARDNRLFVAMDAELELAVDGDVDKAEEIPFALLKDNLKLFTATNAGRIVNSVTVERVGSVE